MMANLTVQEKYIVLMTGIDVVGCSSRMVRSKIKRVDKSMVVKDMQSIFDFCLARFESYEVAEEFLELFLNKKGYGHEIRYLKYVVARHDVGVMSEKDLEVCVFALSMK